MRWPRALAALAPLIALPWCAGAPAGAAPPTAGFRPEALRFKVQWPYDLPEHDRYREEHGAYFFILHNDDKPFARGNRTKPRVEMRFPDYRSGAQEYEADLYVPAGTAGTCVMQIHTGDAEERSYGATTFMLFVEPDGGGSLHFYSQPRELASGVWNRWFHLNVIHDVATHLVSCYIDGRLVFQKRDQDAGDYYMKTGLYAQHGATAVMQVAIRNLHFWSR